MDYSKEVGMRLLVITLMIAHIILTSNLWAHQHHGEESKMMKTANPSVIIMVHLTKDKGMDAEMATRFANISIDRGYRTVIWLTSDGVKLADVKAKETPEVKALKDLVSKGGKVYVCPHCSKVLGVKEIIKGTEFSTPEITFGSLEDSNVKVISW